MDDLRNSNFSDIEEIDLKEIFFKLLFHWRLFVVLGVLGVSIAVIINRYSTDIYKLSTLINIKESENPLAT
jgi:capsular polysaccharide biosynthesis protein